MSWLGNIVGMALPGIGGFIDNLFGGEPSNGEGVSDPLTGKNGIFSNPEGAWDNLKNGRTNDVNKAIADQNLQYQRERNEIEDARYQEETDYNRAFAEDERDYNRAFAEEERDYNRALQQQIFEREDTALERQASSLSAMGINPASQNMNGLGAGQAILSSAPASISAPAASGRGGTALHNDFQMQDMGVLQALSPLATLANTINSVATGQSQRDLIQTQADEQKLKNAILAHDYGIDLFGSGKNKSVGLSYIGDNDFGWSRSKGWKNDYNYGQSYSGFYQGLNAEREFNYKKNNNLYDMSPDFAKNMNYFLSDSFFDTAEKALTRGSQLFDKAFQKDLNNNDNFNPFTKFLNLFF